MKELLDGRWRAEGRCVGGKRVGRVGLGSEDRTSRAYLDLWNLCLILWRESGVDCVVDGRVLDWTEELWTRAGRFFELEQRNANFLVSCCSTPYPRWISGSLYFLWILWTSLEPSGPGLTTFANLASLEQPKWVASSASNVKVPEASSRPTPSTARERRS